MKFQIIDNCKIGKNTKINQFVNLYGCIIGNDCMIGTFVEIQKGATIGNRCRIQSHSFICDGITLEDDVFVGHGVMFINDNHPTVKDTINGTWKFKPTKVEKNVSIGTGAIILGGITIGENAVIGAGAVVTKNVRANTKVLGNPARILKRKPV